MSTKISIIGTGNVGSALARGIEKAGYALRTADADPAEAKAVAAWGDAVILAVPFGAIDAVVETLGAELAGKIVIDVTNALDANMQLALGYSTSGAEELQKKLPDSRVVKAFNTVFAQHMDSGRLGDVQLSAFAASDDAAAKNVVLDLANAIGFAGVDVGPLANARLLEPTGYLNIQLGYFLGLGTQIGITLQRA